MVTATVLVSMLYFALFAFRSADDNALTSWRWIFAGRDVARGLALVNLGLAAALLLARLPWPRSQGGTLLFIISFACAAAFWRQPEVIVDASRYFTQAKHLELHGAGYFLREWGKGIFAWTDLPLVPFLYGAIFKLFGESRLYIQVFVTILFAATVVLTYRLGKRLWGEEVGLAAGALLLGIPYLLTQVPLMLSDVPTMFFFTLAVLAFFVALERGGAWMAVVSPASLFMAIFSKYSTWPLLAAMVVPLLVCALTAPSRQGARTRVTRGVAVALITVVLAGSALALKEEVFLAQIETLRTYQWAGLKRWTESLASTFLFQTSPLLTGAALASLAVALRQKDWRYALVCWPVLPVFLLYTGRIRYLLPVFPFLTLMAAYGLQGIRYPELRKLAVLCAVLPSLAISLFAYLPFLQRTSAANLQRAGDHLNAAGARQVQVITLPPRDRVVNPAVAVPILDLFTHSRIVYRPEGLPRPSVQELTRSSLRFTWEMGSPRYYDGDPARSDAIVVISDAPLLPSPPPALASRLPHDVRGVTFALAGDPFQYKTVVTIFFLKGAGTPSYP